MIRYKQGRWQLYPHKVRYTAHDEERTRYALPNKQWWIDFANKWEHTTIDEFTEVEVSGNMKSRFEEIKYMPEDFMDMYIDYILTGNTSDDVEIPTNHPFNMLRLKKENKDFRAVLDTILLGGY